MIRALAECEFPALKHLEIYFGEPYYGGTGTAVAVDWLLAGDRIPRLRRLGLKDSVV